MTLADMLDLAANRSDAWFDLWQVHFLMTSTLLLLVIYRPEVFSPLKAGALSGLLGLAFLGFATAFWVCYDTRVTIASVTTALAVEALAKGALSQEACLAMLVSDTMRPAFDKIWWGVMYLVYSIIVLGLIWIIPSFKLKSESSKG